MSSILTMFKPADGAEALETPEGSVGDAPAVDTPTSTGASSSVHFGDDSTVAKFADGAEDSGASMAESDEDEDDSNWIFGTNEAIPKSEHYLAGSERPSLSALLGVEPDDGDDEEAPLAEEEEEDPNKVKFGTYRGVFNRCLLNIFGVIMFLRLGWVVGQAGIGLATLIILLSSIVTSLTTISLSAICTNGKVRAGGAYFLISRSLGPLFGGAIGIIFYLANSVAVSLYILGFAETIVDIAASNMTDADINDMRVYGLITSVALLALVLYGVSNVIKAEGALLVLLIASIFFYMIGTFVKSDDDAGVEGYKGSLFTGNFGPSFEDETFFTTLAVFFPAVTGIMAGANISGDLKNPSVNIPVGTLQAVGVSAVVYVILAWMLGATAVNDSSDQYPDAGLKSNFLIMVDTALVGGIVIGGIFAATLSSALASLTGAPRVLQQLARDNLFPRLAYFAKGSGKDDEPVRGYWLTWVITVLCVLIGDLNVVAPLITNFFLVSYALINIACFWSSISKSPGWRPSFKYYNKWAALAGAVLCLSLMVLSDYITAFVTLAACFGLYKWLELNRPDVNWGDATQALMHVNALKSAYRLEKEATRHIKTYRPQYLVLSGALEDRPDMVRFMDCLRKGRGVTVFGNIVLKEADTAIATIHRDRRRTKLLREFDINGFLDATVAPSLREGARQMMMQAGLGKLRPNTLVVGFPEKWSECTDDQVQDYVGTLRDAFRMRYSAVVLRNMTLIDHNRVQRGSIDVWWFVEDGGLTLLLPHLLRQHARWRNCDLRVLLVSPEENVSREKLRMIQLVKNSRVDATIQVVEADRKPKIDDEQLARFSKLSGVDEVDARSRSFIHLGDIIRRESALSAMVVLSMPMPKAPERQNPRLFMAWMDMMCPEDVPTMIMRGNQDLVLTFDA